MTTSSYAILALLSLRPWTGYDLTQQAARSLRFAWPKSERHLYSEPKKLVALGLAKTHKEHVGKRSRNVYEITAEGREALTEWASIPTSSPQLEAEAMLRLLFADHGSLDDLRTVLDEFETDTRELHESVLELMRGYLVGEHPFPERTHLSVLFATFQLEMFSVFEEWIEFARGEIDRWPSTKDLGMNERTELITRIIAEGESVLSNPRLSDSSDSD